MGTGKPSAAGVPCWGLDLRVKPTPSEMLPNLFAGPQRDGAKYTQRYRMNTKKRKLKDHDLRLRTEGYHLLQAEGNGWLPRSTSANTKTLSTKDTTSVMPKVTKGCTDAQVRRPGPSGQVINLENEGGS
jgi:hypothetical protein